MSKRHEDKNTPVKIILSREEISIVDMIIEKLKEHTLIETTRTAIVRAMFTNGYKFYMNWDWLDDYERTAISMKEQEALNQTLEAEMLRDAHDMKEIEEFTRKNKEEQAAKLIAEDAVVA